MHKLMIKTHTITGLKYLCYTRKTGLEYDQYIGSGIGWLKHLDENGIHIHTELIYESEDHNEFVTYARAKSIELNIVDSIEWANLKLEEGDGGDTVSNKMWITDGSTSKYILKTEPIPNGWRRGRSNCVFNNKELQSQFSKRCDPITRGHAIKKTWDSGNFKRDHSKCGLKGDLNVSKRLEVRAKISAAARKRSEDKRKKILNE